MSKLRDMQGIIRHFKEVTGKREVDMREVAAWAVKRGMKLPKPVDPLDRLAEQFSRAAREETKRDPRTGRPYRVNHAVTHLQTKFTFWIDIDEAPRKYMQKSLVQRREQTIGDIVQLTFDAEHWNNAHPAEDPIVIETDFTPDVEWRKNVPVVDEKPDEEDDAVERSAPPPAEN